MGQAAVVGRDHRGVSHRRLGLERGRQAKAGGRCRQRVGFHHPVAILLRHGVRARALEKHHVQARGMLLVIGAGEGHAGAVSQDGFVARLQDGAGAGPRLRGDDADVADLRNQSRIGGEIGRWPVGAGCNHKRREKEAWKGDVERRREKEA